uniref:MAM domain-containing protein n=1 Tax=Megaselia scalaris TaxID=36166 RepID=T1GM18_MEGSC
MLLEQDLQLSRLRHNLDDSALTNFNPNYGCDGILNGNIDVKSLPQVSRESLKLVLPVSSENDEDRMRQSHSNEFPSLQATNSSDYLIPLTHQRITETSPHVAENLAVYSNPVTTSPSVPTITPPHQFIDQTYPYVRTNGDIKLISLDTPQATPTTVKPPMSFNQMDGITLNPSALPNAHYNKSYANIEVNDPSKCNGVIPTSKMNGHASSNGSPDMNEEHFGVKCFFESKCAWVWEENGDDSFQITTASELHRLNITGLTPGPNADMLDDANGNFLYAKRHFGNLRFRSVDSQSNLENGFLRVVIEPTESQESSSIIAEVAGDNLRKWKAKRFQIGRISRDFRVSLEIIPSIQKTSRGSIALDNIRMTDCFPQGTRNDKCSSTQLKCKSSKIPVCIPLSRICDLVVDCDDAEDELRNCDKIPNGGICDFENPENDWCGWHDPGKSLLTWSRHAGASPTQDTGPTIDHTFQNTSGHYMLVNMNQFANDSEKKDRAGFASNAIMYSRIFNPPPTVHGIPGHPFSNSCIKFKKKKTIRTHFGGVIRIKDQIGIE